MIVRAKFKIEEGINLPQIKSTFVNLITVFLSAAIGAATPMVQAGQFPNDWPSLKKALTGAAVVGGCAAYHWLVARTPTSVAANAPEVKP